MLYRIIRALSLLRYILNGAKNYEERFKLFYIERRLSTFEIKRRLADICHQYNHLSLCYKGQIWTTRALMADGFHQIHLRFYYEGDRMLVTGHYELEPEMFPFKHMKGVDLRCLDNGEILKIKWSFYR